MSPGEPATSMIQRCYIRSKARSNWRPWLAGFVKAFFFASVLKAQTPLGPAFLVNPESVGAQDSPDLQFDGAGSLWFVWTDLIGLEPESDRVMARALSPEGELGPTSVLVDTSDIPLTPALAPLIAPLHAPSGGFML